MAAACGFGAAGLKTTNFELGSFRPKLSSSQLFSGLRTRKSVQFHGLPLSIRSRNAVIGSLDSAPQADSASSDDKAEKTNSSEVLVSNLTPKLVEVESLLTVLCGTTSIAELELKRAGFRLYVRRNLVEQNAPPLVEQNAPPSPAETPLPSPVVSQTTVDTPSSGSALALSRPVTSSSSIQRFLDKAADEGLVILNSPRVGYFRRCRVIKGKRTPPLCRENDLVKEGKAICFIEQLGAQIPIKSDVSGEVVKILKEDGDPVGYGDPLIAILPSFPGIKRLQ